MSSNERAQSLLAEYKKLLEEAEHSQGLDEEDLPRQLKEIKTEYKKLTGKDIDLI